ncbi:MAG: GNAT family N-acetyltransferase [Bacteroidia bacterium]
MYTVTEPTSTSDFEKYFKLRFEVLRKPWGQAEGSEKDDQENESVHAMIKGEQGEALAVCRLQMNDAHTAQVRYMGVKEGMQGKGLGKKIMNYMEGRACEKGAEKVILHARENAVDFYKNCGYSLVEKSYLMWGTIQHYLMEKKV